MKNKLGTIGLVFILIEALSILILNGITLKQEIEESIDTKSEVSFAITVPTYTWINPTYMVLNRPDRDIIMVSCNGISYVKEVIYTKDETTYRKLCNIFDDWTTGKKRYERPGYLRVDGITINGVDLNLLNKPFKVRMGEKFADLTGVLKRFSRAIYGRLKDNKELTEDANYLSASI